MDRKSSPTTVITDEWRKIKHGRFQIFFLYVRSNTLCCVSALRQPLMSTHHLLTPNNLLPSFSHRTKRLIVSQRLLKWHNRWALVCFHRVRQWPFRKTATMGTLASQAEIGVWVQAPGTLLRGYGSNTPENFWNFVWKIPQSGEFWPGNCSKCRP